MVCFERESTMKFSGRIRPLSYLKARAPEVIRGLAESREPMIITVNGEAKAVMQDIASYEESQEALALLKLLALSNKDVEAGRLRPVGEAFAAIRERAKR
jgi:prevent-host-death family protein